MDWGSIKNAGYCLRFTLLDGIHNHYTLNRNRNRNLNLNRNPDQTGFNDTLWIVPA